MTDKDMFKGITYESLDKQIGGKHYWNMKIQPAEFINENKLLFAEGNAIKYICRHQNKGKAHTSFIHRMTADSSKKFPSLCPKE